MQENILQSKKHKKRRKRSENGILAGSIILCLITLSAITICLVVAFKYRSAQLENVTVMNELNEVQKERDAAYTQEEVDTLVSDAVAEAVAQTSEETANQFLGELKEQMLSGEGTTSMLRYFFPDEIVVADAGQYYFFPISDELAHHTYNVDGFWLDRNQVMHYFENDNDFKNDNEASHKGIDVSRYQEKIDWKKVAGDEVEYAFIRLGIRGYTKGEILQDDTFIYNIEGALDNDIDVGVYFFTQAVSVEEAEEEARFVLDAIEPYPVKYPIVLDVEAVTSANARTADLTKEERTQYCIAFLETIKKAGYKPMIYGNLKTFMLLLDLEQLEEYDKWFAYYDADIYFPYAFKIWQYTDKGRVDGIKGEVDLNISFEDLSDE